MMIGRISAALQSPQLNQVWRMRYYAVGLALQKGLAVALLPLIVAIFGRETFSQYALLMSTVQLYATVVGVGVPLAVLPLWFRSPQPLAFTQMALAMVLIAALVFSVVAWFAAAIWTGEVLPGISGAEAALWVAAMALLYNANLIAFSVARSQGRQAAFVVANFIGALALVAGLLLAWELGATGLRTLTLAQMAALLACSVPLLGFQLLVARGAFAPGWRERAGSLLRFSLPLMTNSLLLLLAMNVDKWAALAFFTKEEFASYVIDYQMGFAILFVPAVVALHYGPIFAELVARGDAAAMMRAERSASRVVVVGWAATALAAFGYAMVAGLKLTPGYWALALTFLFQGLYLVKSNQLMAEMRSARLFASSVIALPVFVAALLLAGWLNSLVLLYLAYPIYDGLLLALVSHRRSARTTN